MQHLSIFPAFHVAGSSPRPPKSAALEEAKEKNKAVVRELYDALRSGDVDTIERILAPDLEWWFHGPPHCQHLMRFLTGRCDRDRLAFSPLSLTPLANKVLVEGREGQSLYWVHVWTLDNGVVTQLREYCNTSLLVTEFKPATSATSAAGCCPLWQSGFRQSDGESMPGLVLSI